MKLACSSARRYATLQWYRAGMKMFESAKCRARHLQNDRDEAERKQKQLLLFLG